MVPQEWVHPFLPISSYRNRIRNRDRSPSSLLRVFRSDLHFFSKTKYSEDSTERHECDYDYEYDSDCEEEGDCTLLFIFT